LALQKAWKCRAKSEATSAGLRRLFEESQAEDEVTLQALLEVCRSGAAAVEVTLEGMTLHTLDRACDMQASFARSFPSRLTDL